MRICPGCNREYPRSITSVRCVHCKSNFSEQLCSTCNEWKSADNYYLYSNGTPRRECKNCGRLRKLKFDKDNRQQRYDRDRRFFDKRKATTVEQIASWREKVDKLPFKLMTEPQWLEACDYFKGCVVCGDKHIETRQYFIPFMDGGKYTAWNIFPMCGTCSTKKRMIQNPFAWIDKYKRGS
jgi:hypothetical protein